MYGNSCMACAPKILFPPHLLEGVAPGLINVVKHVQQYLECLVFLALP